MRINNKILLALALMCLTCCKKQQKVDSYLEKKIGIDYKYAANIENYITCDNCFLFIVHPSRCYACLNEIIEYLSISIDSLNFETRLLLTDSGINSSEVKIFKTEILNTYIKYGLSDYMQISFGNTESSNLPSFGLFIKAGEPQGHFIISNNTATSVLSKYQKLSSYINN